MLRNREYHKRARRQALAERVAEISRGFYRRPVPADPSGKSRPGLADRSNRARLQRRRIAGDGLTTPDQKSQSLGGSGPRRPLELTTADWLEELAVYGTARNLRDQELAYQLSLVIENLYLVRGALWRNS